LLNCALRLGMASRAQQTISDANESERAKRGSFPWERQDGESVQAFARFLVYRDTEPTDRSLRKVEETCGISGTLVSRWSKKWSWVKRAVAYDSWKLELSDELGKHGALVHRRKLVRFGSASLDRALNSLNKMKVESVDDVVALAEAGDQLARRALNLTEPTAKGGPATVVQVGVAWPGQGGPAWANRIEPNVTQPLIEQKPNETKSERNIVVSCGEQVIAEGVGTAARTRVTPSGSPDKPNCVDATAVRPVRLIEKVVKSPDRVKV